VLLTAFPATRDFFPQILDHDAGGGGAVSVALAVVMMMVVAVVVAVAMSRTPETFPVVFILIVRVHYLQTIRFARDNFVYFLRMQVKQLLNPRGPTLIHP
jgi:hypothetical protein